MPSILTDIAFGIYLFGLLFCIFKIYYDSSKINNFLLITLLIGFAIHSTSIIYKFFVIGTIPITNMYESSSFFAWAVMVIFFYLHYRYRLTILALFILPIVSLLMVVSLSSTDTIKPISPVLNSIWLLFHATFAFVGNASFAVASGIGVMYLIQERYLKKKKKGGFFNKLPSVQILDEINYKLITIGFPLITFAIITGALWAESAFGFYWRWDPKETWSLFTWFIYALILHLRIIRGWRGKKAAILSIFGFIAVLFTYYGVNFLMESYHSFK
ncbi:MAG: c-type cytochrome biogenesis protein CcsB [Thermodesulfovibrionales bacterium]|nr:c-type cytochrome biogenesis protein CcsB [Thermodesulfovibrionales bacterium]